MRGDIILSHGFDSGPEAAKTSAMAALAEQLGWRTQRPDYRDLDALGMVEAGKPRCERLLALARAVDGPLVLAGSSFGAYISGLVAQQVACAGLFLLSTPVAKPEATVPFALPKGVPAALVHGFDDEVCPAEATLDFARRFGLRLWMLPDGHRLANHVDRIAQHFGAFLRELDAAPQVSA